MIIIEGMEGIDEILDNQGVVKRLVELTKKEE